jgi:hypothetical protein
MIVGILIALAMYPLMIIIFTIIFSRIRCEDDRYEEYWKIKEEQAYLQGLKEATDLAEERNEDGV